MALTNFQKTIKKSVQYQGTGIFSGKLTTLKIFPAPPDNGIVFQRVDLPGKPKITATPENAHYKYRRTALVKDSAEIETVEHFMSATFGLGIDNLVVEIDSNEIPVADGSAEHFVKLFLEAGIEEQNTTKKELTLTNNVEIKEADAFIVATPFETGLEISYTLSYQQDFIGTQFFNVKLNEETYAKEISPARTFVLASEIDNFLKDGIGKGANTKNTLVVESSYIRDNTLRFKNEFVRHKILDLIGDLSLLGKSIKAHIIATKSGHNLNLEFVKKLLKQESKVKTSLKYNTMLDVREILKILPHRYPLLLIDKVIEIDSYKYAVGIKNVTFNEPFFQGHFPDQPIMPGVLQIEAMAQLAGALLMRKAENQNKLAVLMSIDNVKFRRTVVPGDQLKIEATVLRLKTRTGLVHTRATVDDKLVSEAYMKFIISDKE